MCMEKTKRIGSKTAAFIVLATLLAIAAQFIGLDGVPLLMKGWPIFLIILGIEIWLSPQKSEQKMQLAWGKLALAVIVSLGAMFSFQGWIWFAKENSFPFGISTEEHADYSTIDVPLSSSTNSIYVNNRSGNAEIIASNRGDVLIEAEIVQFFTRGKAASDRNVKINVDEKNDTLYIEVETKRQQFGFVRMTPSVHLTIHVPEKTPLNYKLSQRNGNIYASDIPIRRYFEASTTNGRVEVSDLTGDLRLESTNGAINGKSLIGNIYAKTTNGKVSIDGELERVDVETTNGKIEVASQTVKDDWNVSTTNSGIELSIPDDASVRLDGKTTNGSVKVDPPFEVDGKRVSGTMGSGEHHIELKTTNGSIAVNLR